MRQPGDGPNQFMHKGSLEEIHSDSSAMRTATESIADSSIYKELADDMDGFLKFVEKQQKREEEIKKLEQQQISMESTMKSSTTQNMQHVSLKEQMDKKKEEDIEMRILRQDPEAHFKRLKAQIKLKVIKKY